MFSIKTPYNSCRSTKVVNPSASPFYYTKDIITYGSNNQVLDQTLFYQNNTHINNSPSLSCLVNSTKTKLTYQKYDPTRNPLL
jgi:hypothetical protein